MLRAGALAVWMVLLPVAAQAADPGPPPPTPPPAAPADLPPPPPPPPPPSGRECYPACGAGSVCNDGVCSSASPPTDAPRAQPGVVVGEDGERAPPGFHFESQRRRALLITGPILLGVGYLVAAGFGFLSSISYTYAYGYSNGSPLLNFIPLAGPVLARLSYGASYTNFGDWLFTGAVTALQLTGLTLLLVGLPHHQVLVPNEYDGPQERQRDSTLPPIQWSLSPFAPGAPLGLTLTVLN